MIARDLHLQTRNSALGVLRSRGLDARPTVCCLRLKARAPTSRCRRHRDPLLEADACGHSGFCQPFPASSRLRPNLPTAPPATWYDGSLTCLDRSPWIPRRASGTWSELPGFFRQPAPRALRSAPKLHRRVKFRRSEPSRIYSENRDCCQIAHQSAASGTEASAGRSRPDRPDAGLAPKIGAFHLTERRFLPRNRLLAGRFRPALRFATRGPSFQA
jgi:hypothetical protein